MFLNCKTEIQFYMNFKHKITKNIVQQKCQLDNVHNYHSDDHY
jgi:hypothetical protein